MKFPIINIPLIEFTRRTLLSGGIGVKGMLMLLLYYLQLIVSLPFTLLQWLLFSRRINKTALLKDPVFILGHYRSGTTYLHKLMASDRQFGVLTNYDAQFANSNLLLGEKMQPLIQWILHLFRVRNPFFHDTIVVLSEPTEEDDYLMNKGSAYSAYWGLLFPKRWNAWLNGSTQMADTVYRQGWKKEYLNTLKYISFKNKGKQLVLKSPPNTERISILLEMFPQAKFIYLHRNPYHLFYSMRNMWKRAILKFYSLQHITETELDEIVFSHFAYLIDHYEKEKYLIPVANLIEVSYEELKQDPFKTLEKIYASLSLPGFESAADLMLRELEAESGYTNFEYHFSDDTFKRIEARWEKYIRMWEGKEEAP